MTDKLDALIPDYCKLADASCRCIRASNCTYGSGIDPDKLAALFEAIDCYRDAPLCREMAMPMLIFEAANACRIKEETDTATAALEAMLEDAGGRIVVVEAEKETEE